MDVNRPLLRWAGSKRKLLPILRQATPKKFNCYIEPFCGSACLYIDRKPEKALLSDNNSELIHFYRRLQIRPAHIARLAHAMPISEQFYYDLRSTFPASLSSDDRAARFLYLNRYCFNGVYRTNNAGYFNVPRGKHMGNIPSIDEIEAFGRFIRSAEFLTSDFEDIVALAGPGDFIYLDPPYAGRDVRDRGEYGANAFKQQDIERFALACNAAASRGIHVMISYADIPILDTVFQGWNIQRLSVSRSVSGFARGRTVVQEVLLSNY